MANTKAKAWKVNTENTEKGGHGEFEVDGLKSKWCGEIWQRVAFRLQRTW